MRAVGLGDDHQAGGVLVEPVHDARPLHPADAGKSVPAMGDQRIDQRAGRVAGGGMHHEAGRLVDHDDLAVLIYDVERDVLRLRHRLASGGGTLTLMRVARIDAIARIADRAPADRDRAFQNQRFQPRARQRFDAGGEHAIETLAGLRRRRHQAVSIRSREGSMTASEDNEKPLDPAAERIVARVRWLSMLSGVATIIGIAVVIGVVGYRLFKSDGSVTEYDVVAVLPKGAKVTSIGTAGDRIVVTIDINGSPEIRTFEARSLQPAGRLKFANEP